MIPKKLFLFLFLFSFSLSFVSADAFFNTDLPDIDMTLDDYTSLDIDDYATNNDNDANVLSFINPDSGAGVILYGDTGGEHTNSVFTVTLTQGGLIQFLSYDEELNGLEMYLGISDTPLTSQASDTFILSIQEDETPSQIASISPVVLGSTGSRVINMNNYFTAYDNVNVTYYNGSSNQSLYTGKGGNTVSNDGDVDVTVSPSSQNILITITSNGNVYSQNFSLNVCNDVDCVSAVVPVSTSATGGNAPYQIASIPTFQFVTPDSHNFHVEGVQVGGFDDYTLDDYFFIPSSGGTLHFNYTLNNGTHSASYDNTGNSYNDTFWLENFPGIFRESSELGNIITSQGVPKVYMGLTSDFVSNFGSGYQYNFTATIHLYNDVGSVVAQHNITMSDSVPAGNSAQQILTLQPPVLTFDDTYYVDINDIFIYHDNVTVTVAGYEPITLTHGGTGYIEVGDDNLTVELSEIATNSIRLIFISHQSSLVKAFTIEVCNTVGCDSLDSTVTVSGSLSDIDATGTGLWVSLVRATSNIFPDSSGMSLPQKYATMLVFHLVLSILVFVAFGSSSGVVPLVSFLNLILFLFFASMGYVNFGGVLIVAVLLFVLSFAKKKMA